MSTTVIHVRVPRRLKEELERYGLNVSDEVRRLLELRVKMLRLEELLREIEEDDIESSADSVRLVREDREEKGRRASA